LGDIAGWKRNPGNGEKDIDTEIKGMPKEKIGQRLPGRSDPRICPIIVNS